MTYCYLVAIMSQDDTTQPIEKSFEVQSEERANQIALKLLTDNPNRTIIVYRKTRVYVAKQQPIQPLIYSISDKGEVLPV